MVPVQGSGDSQRARSPSWHVLVAWALGPGVYAAFVSAFGLGLLPIEPGLVLVGAMVMLYLHVASAFALLLLACQPAMRRPGEFRLLAMYWLFVAVWLVRSWYAGGERTDTTDALAVGVLMAALAVPLWWGLRMVLAHAATGRRPG